MPHNFGGRTGVVTRLTPVTAHAYGRSSVRTAPCLTESFDGADSDTIGPDVAWDQYGLASPVGGTIVYGAGVGGHIKDNRCSVYAPSGSPDGNPDYQWIQAVIQTRSQDAFASDVAITADLHHVSETGGAGNEGNMIIGGVQVLARMETESLDPGGTFPYPTGWWAQIAMEGGYHNVRCRIGWQTPSYSGALNGFGTFIGTDFPDPCNLGLTIVGQDMDLVVTSYINDAQIETYTMADILGPEGYSDVLDDPSYLPRGERVGFQVYGGVEYSVSGGVTTGSYHGHDDDAWIDNYQACRA